MRRVSNDRCGQIKMQDFFEIIKNGRITGTNIFYFLQSEAIYKVQIVIGKKGGDFRDEWMWRPFWIVGGV